MDTSRGRFLNRAAITSSPSKVLNVASNPGDNQQSARITWDGVAHELQPTNSSIAV